MSVARSTKCLFCTFKQTAKKESSTIRRFHNSPINSARQKPGTQTVKTDVDKVKRLSEKDIASYSPQQADAIRATQSKLSETFERFDQETQLNRKPWTMHYVQNMTEIDPVIDKPVKAPWSNLDDDSRLKTEDELNQDILDFMQNMPSNDKDAEKAFEKFVAENRLTKGKPEAEYAPRSATAPDIPRMTKKAGKETSTGAKRGRDEGQGGNEQEVSPALIRLMQMTGLNQRQLSGLRVKSIITHRVVNQTRLGKIQKQYWLSIAGDGNGLLGVGEGKSEESAEGMIQSQYRAIRNMQPVMRYENRTIYGDVKGKSGATELELYSRAPGFGLRCQHNIWEMCRCAGISDLAARVTRARNPMNTVKAAFQALLSQKDPEEIAKGRGKKLVDVRKVYYAGNV